MLVYRTMVDRALWVAHGERLAWLPGQSSGRSIALGRGWGGGEGSSSSTSSASTARDRTLGQVAPFNVQCVIPSLTVLNPLRKWKTKLDNHAGSRPETTGKAPDTIFVILEP
jgi:hypothetical protein